MVVVAMIRSRDRTTATRSSARRRQRPALWPGGRGSAEWRGRGTTRSVAARGSIPSATPTPGAAFLVSVSLDGVANDGVGGVDNVNTDIENVTGSPYAGHADWQVLGERALGPGRERHDPGGAGNDTLSGGGADDSLGWRLGNDVVTGGTGTDAGGLFEAAWLR